METRNTSVLREVIEALSSELDDVPYALDRLESHFHDRLIVAVGNVALIGVHAEHLRLNITEQERSTVLDHIADQKMAVVTIDHVETAINELFEDRFIEP